MSSFVLKSPCPFSAWAQGVRSGAVPVSCEDPGPRTAAGAGGTASPGCWGSQQDRILQKAVLHPPKACPTLPRVLLAQI